MTKELKEKFENVAPKKKKKNNREIEIIKRDQIQIWSWKYKGNEKHQ